jgi:hypothetical protein
VATATPTQPPRTAIGLSTRPLALWHLLSLDAPTVAALWTWFIAYTNHIHLPFSSILAMAFAVWMLYAADRLMDARLLENGSLRHDDLEARHYFHHRHRFAFLCGILLASIALSILLPQLDSSAIHLYLILGGFVFGYFILIHASSIVATGRNAAPRIPKEIAVGLFFAAAIFIPTVARMPNLRLMLLPSALLFAALCSLNCLFIYAWEHSIPANAHWITARAISNLHLLTALFIAAGILLGLAIPSAIPCSLASVAGATALLLLDRIRPRLSCLTLRASADAALLTPLLSLLLLSRC